METYPQIIDFDLDVFDYFTTQYVFMFCDCEYNLTVIRSSEHISANTISILPIPRRGIFPPSLIRVRPLSLTVHSFPVPHHRGSPRFKTQSPKNLPDAVATKSCLLETSTSENPRGSNGSVISLNVPMGLLIRGMAASCGKSCPTTLSISRFRGVCH